MATKKKGPNPKALLPAMVEDVAKFLDEFDQITDHPWRLSDVVRYKFGLIPSRKVRINPWAKNARARAAASRFKTEPGA